VTCAPAYFTDPLIFAVPDFGAVAGAASDALPVSGALLAVSLPPPPQAESSMDAKLKLATTRKTLVTSILLANERPTCAVHEMKFRLPRAYLSQADAISNCGM
jgi:hypothetical protein